MATYKIMQGDTLGGIAAKNKTTVAELQKLNPSITDPNKIYAGSSIITSADLTPTPKIDVPPSPYPQDLASLSAGALGGVNYSPKTITLPNGTVVDSATGTVISETPSTTISFGERLKGLLGGAYEPTTPVSSVGEYQKQITSPEFIAKQKELEAANAELAGLAAEQQSLQMQGQYIPEAMQVASEGRGRTAAGLAPLTAGELRKNALAMLPVTQRILGASARANAAKGNLDMANSNVENILKLQEQDRKNNMDYKNQLFERALLVANDEEKQQLENKKAELELSDKKEGEFFAQKKLFVDAAISEGDFKTAGNLALATNVDQLSTLAKNIKTTTTITGGKSGAVAQVTDNNTIQSYADLLATGKITLANVPQSVRNAVVQATGGVINKPLSDTAIKEIQQSESAIANLNALRTVVQNNLQYVGPISGLARFNPWSQARKAQAEIDRVRQQVGKTLEGGVLRKEDEEKYKKILATLADTPETALYKIDSLISAIQRDTQSYQSLQQSTGKFVPGAGQSTPEALRSKYNY